jgi:hypothetical protein
MKQPVDHILRPQLPWRTDAGITECGLDASKAGTLTREQFFARLKDYGQQRTALLTCMTCSDTARRWGTWADDPRKALEREVQWETAWRRDDRGVRLRDELTAIAALIDAHREEFDAQLSRIEAQRDWNQKKALVQRKSPEPRIRGGL